MGFSLVESNYSGNIPANNATVAISNDVNLLDLQDRNGSKKIQHCSMKASSTRLSWADQINYVK